MAKRPDYLWFTVFDEQRDHGRLPALAALLGAVDRAPYSSNFAGIRHAKTSKRFDEPLSVPLNDEVLPHPNDDGTHAVPFTPHASV
ncbi:MAG: hypothetical protein WBD97_03670 [Pseudolabrys sp.]